MKRLLCRVGVLGLMGLIASLASAAHAQLLIPTAGGTVLATSGDDFSVGPRSLGFTGTFFGTSQTNVFVNSNGNLSFGAGNTNFTNPAFPTGTPPTIAPGWDDLFLPPGQIVENTGVGYYAATWDGVGNFSNNNSVTMQAVLVGPSSSLTGIGLMDGDIVFGYGNSTGINDGTTVGLNAGNGTGFAVLPGYPTDGQLNNGQFLSLNNTQWLFRPNAAGGYNVGPFVPGVPVPEPGSLAVLMGAGIAGAGLFVRRRNR